MASIDALIRLRAGSDAGAIDASEALYALRGDTYMVVFQSIVDLKAFDAAVAAIEKASWDEALAEHCRASYAEVAKQRGR